MQSPTKFKQPLGERSTNIPSPMKSPSKIPLPPSPAAAEKQSRREPRQVLFADLQGPMSQLFSESKQSEKPTLVRKISEAHDSGHTYVSPSDDILSPATKKLSEVRGRRFGNFKKSSSLYNAKSLFNKASENTSTPSLFEKET